MSNSIKCLFMILLVASCTGNENEQYVDEIHRPQDWHAQFSFVVFPDTLNDASEVLEALDLSKDTKVQNLVDQLFDLAFSGDAEVYLPGVLGEKDQLVDAKQLQKALESFDSTSVEDLYTGEWKDTVIDASFKKSAVSALQIGCLLSTNNKSLSVIPEWTMIGEQIFTEDGDFRGFRPQFFVELESDPISENGIRVELNLATDSLGLFRVKSISSYHDIAGKPVQSMLKMKDGKPSHVQFHMGFGFKERMILIEEVKVSKNEIYTNQEV